MLRADFSFDLPPELIAQEPLAERSASRLLVLREGELQHRMMRDLPMLLSPNDLLVVNDTRVIKARLLGTKDSGGQAELLVERLLDAYSVLAQVRVSKPLKPGRFVAVENAASEVVLLMIGERRGQWYEVEFPQPVLEVLDRFGHVPLPPYVQRQDNEQDRERYQTVFAERSGAIAAPTAGLHFDDALLASIAAHGVRMAKVTLHVGAGTFQPMRVDRVEDHEMHEEWCEVTEQTVDAIAQAKQRGGRVVAVGTTVVRTLETAACGGSIAPFSGATSLFIKPGYSFRCVDGLVTNFHLPESSLLVLVCAFSGYRAVMAAYAAAVAERYRFYSYGDAMLLWPEQRVQ